MSRRPRTRAVVVLPVAAALLAGAGGTAYAVAKARATADQALATTTFGAQASLAADSGPSGPLQLTYTGTDRTARLFFLRNTGSLGVTGQTWTLTVTNTAGGTKGDVSLTTCSTGYTATGGCTGTESPFLTVTENVSTARHTSTFAVPVRGATAFKFTPNQARGYTASIDVGVSRAQTASPAGTASAG